MYFQENTEAYSFAERISCFEIQKETRRVSVQSSKCFLEKWSIALLAVSSLVASSCARRCTHLLCSIHSSLHRVMSVGFAIQVLPKLICICQLACHVSYDLYHRFCFNCSKKHNCCSLFHSICIPQFQQSCA